eukprot:242236-Pyramimonas_sp.AAC.1
MGFGGPAWAFSEAFRAFLGPSYTVEGSSWPVSRPSWAVSAAPWTRERPQGPKLVIYYPYGFLGFEAQKGPLCQGRRKRCDWASRE